MVRSFFAFFLLVAVTFSTNASELSKGDLKILRDAYDQLLLRKFDEARTTADGAEDKLVPTLITFLYLTDKTSFPTFGEAAVFLAEHPDWPSQDTLLTKAEAGLTPGLGAETLAGWFDGNPPRTGRGALLQAGALRELGRSDALTKVVKQAWSTLSFSEDEEKEFLAAYGSLLTTAEEEARLRLSLDAGWTNQAARQVLRVEGDLAALATARLALQNREKGARDLVDALPAAVADDGGLQVDLAAYLYDRETFSALDEQLLSMGPGNGGRPADVWGIRAKAMRRLLLLGESQTAYSIAAGHGLTEGTGFAELEWGAGWIALERLSDPATALTHFTRYYEGSKTSISLGKAAYWAALAAEALKQEQVALDWLAKSAEHATAFYGQLAAARLGQEPGANLPKMPRLDEAVLTNYLAGDLPRAALALSKVGDYDNTTLFVMHLARQATSAEGYQLAGALAEQIGRTDLVVKSAKVARNKGIILIDYLFPRPALDDSVVPEEALVYALIRQESEFDRKAESSAGALGLMQLMPKTAKGVAKDVGLDYDKAALTDDPAYNIKLGRAYLAEMVDRFDGSFVLAAAAYNAGPSRPEQWIELNGDPRKDKIDLVEWIEAIPFDETRNYVMRVNEGVVVYRHLLGNSDVAAWEGFNPAGQGPEGARLPLCCQLD